MRWGLVLVGLAACGGAGVDLEIHSDVAIASVEVFVGHTGCWDDEANTECPGVAWLDGQLRPPGHVYLTQSASPTTEARIVPEADGSRYVIRLEADAAFADTAVIAIVGFDANGTAAAVGMVWGQRIPTNSAAHWIVELEPADPAVASFRDAPQADDAPIRVAVWGREGTPEQAEGSRCVAVQQWDGSTQWKGTFIVPSSDHDCDGELPELECDEHYFNLNQRPINSLLQSCLSTTPLDAGNPCVVGVTTCSDGVSSDSTCAVAPLGRTPVCVPDQLCEECSDPFAVETCVSMAARRSSVSHAECRLGASADGTTCGQGGPGYSTHLALPFPCNAIELRTVGSPLATGMPFPFAAPWMIGDAEISIYADAGPTCNIYLYFKQGVANVTSSMHVLALRADNTKPLLLVPLRVAFDTVDCTNTTPTEEMCTVSDSLAGLHDHIVTCAGMAPVP